VKKKPSGRSSVQVEAEVRHAGGILAGKVLAKLELLDERRFESGLVHLR
jgi:hypothetical protein